jgi:hypothetical protein
MRTLATPTDLCVQRWHVKWSIKYNATEKDQTTSTIWAYSADEARAKITGSNPMIWISTITAY